MKRLALLVVLATLFVSRPVLGQITVTYTFSPGTTISSSQVNQNFTDLGAALNRTGGTMTGVLTLIGGAVGAPALTTTGDTNTGVYFPAADSFAVTLGGTQRFLANASGLTAFGVNFLNSSGKIPELSSTYFASLSGANLTGIPAASIAAGTITATFSGNLTGAVTGNASTASALAANPSDCGSNTFATTIDAAGNLTCTSVGNAATTATSANTASAIVTRDASGNFSAGTITATFSGNLTGNVTGNTSGSSGSTTGNAATASALAANPTDCSSNQFASSIDAAGNLTCGAVGNAATTATSANTASAIVARDGSGNFSAGTITASLTGNVTGNVSGSSGSTTGNAATVTSGVYTNGSYANPSWITSLAAAKVGLGSVENTALSTWAGSGYITTLGTLGSLTVSGETITFSSLAVASDKEYVCIDTAGALSHGSSCP